jgi:hypothetical protein
MTYDCGVGDCGAGDWRPGSADAGMLLETSSASTRGMIDLLKMSSSEFDNFSNIAANVSGVVSAVPLSSEGSGWRCCLGGMSPNFILASASFSAEWGQPPGNCGDWKLLVDAMSGRLKVLTSLPNVEWLLARRPSDEVFGREAPSVDRDRDGASKDLWAWGVQADAQQGRL